MLFMKLFVEIKTIKKGKKTLLYISIAYYIKKKGGGEGVQIACKNAYAINGRPPMNVLDAHNESLNKLDL